MEFKKIFRVKSKGKKEQEKEDETRRTYSVCLTDLDNEGIVLWMHSEAPLDLKLSDELELRSIKHQKSLKDSKGGG